MDRSELEWDLFISYSSEDRESAARPIRDMLAALGINVWFDETELLIGDSLRQRIDDGLSRSRYGLIILSKSFFSRQWPKQELNGLVQREADGEKVILPVWHGVTAEDVRRESPMLADRIAVNTNEGIPVTCLKILRVIRPDIIEKVDREISSRLLLPRITTGRELFSVIFKADAFLPLNDEPHNKEEADLIGSFLEYLQDWGDIADDIGTGANVQAQYSISEDIKALDELGFCVYAARQPGRVNVAGKSIDWTVAAVAVLRGKERSPYLIGNDLFVDLPSDDTDSK